MSSSNKYASTHLQSGNVYIKDFIYLREHASVGGGAEQDRKNLKQVPHSAWSQSQGSISQP